MCPGGHNAQAFNLIRAGSIIFICESAKLALPRQWRLIIIANAWLPPGLVLAAPADTNPQGMTWAQIARLPDF
jgi:hypothetical protein